MDEEVGDLGQDFAAARRDARVKCAFQFVEDGKHVRYDPSGPRPFAINNANPGMKKPFSAAFTVCGPD
jgi:hypothetical protein